MKRFSRKRLVLSLAAIAGMQSMAVEASVVDNPFFRVLGIVIVWAADSGGTAPVASDFVLMTATSGSAGHDIISGDVRPVLTGTMEAIPSNSTTAGTIMQIDNAVSGGVFTDSNNNGFLDAADSLTAFQMDATTDVSLASNTIQHSFYVASNTAFDIYAQANGYTASGGFASGVGIGMSLGITVTGTDGGFTFGGQAQDPSTGGTGVFAGTNDVATTLSAATKVFDGGRRTAASNGAIIGQSVRFDATYTLNDLNNSNALGYDLSMGTGSIETTVTYTIYVP